MRAAGLNKCVSENWVPKWQWTGYILIGGLEEFLFFHLLGIITPTDFHIFQRGRSTTNQYRCSIEADWLFMDRGFPLTFFGDGHESKYGHRCHWILGIALVPCTWKLNSGSTAPRSSQPRSARSVNKTSGWLMIGDLTTVDGCEILHQLRL